MNVNRTPWLAPPAPVTSTLNRTGREVCTQLHDADFPPATVRLTAIVNDLVLSVDVCADCARRWPATA